MTFSFLDSLLGLASKFKPFDDSQKRAIQVEACVLEDRLLYSATVLPVDIDPSTGDTIAFEVTQSEIDAILDCIDESVRTVGGTESGVSDVQSSSVDATDDALAAPGSNFAQSDYAALDQTNDAVLDASETTQPEITSVILTGETRPTLSSVDYQDALPALSSSSDGNAATADDPASGVHSIVIVDAKIQDADQLLSGLGLDDYEVFFLNGETDGLAQITDILSHYGADSVSSIHIIGHGGAGAVELGNMQLTLDNLDEYSTMLGQWQDELTANADILIYGCEVAKTDSGQDLLTQISTLTGADLAASTNVTASASLGGDWELEFHTGLIEARLEKNFEALDNYMHALVTGTNSADFIVGTSALDSHSGLSGNDLILGGASVLSDGQFTSATVSGNWSTFNSGSTMGGWSVTAGSVDLQSGTYQPTPTGGRSLDIDGSAPGTISQTISTVAGNTYVMRFMMSANATGVATKALEVNIGGASRDYSITTTGSHTASASDWFEQTYVFVATSSSTTINIRSLSSSGNAGAVIGDLAIADLTTANGNDTLAGDDGNDSIYGSGGNDTITGGNGNDKIYAGAGTNTIDGGANTDIVVFTGNRASSAATSRAVR